MPTAASVRHGSHHSSAFSSSPSRPDAGAPEHISPGRFRRTPALQASPSPVYGAAAAKIDPSSNVAAVCPALNREERPDAVAYVLGKPLVSPTSLTDRHRPARGEESRLA